MHRNNIAVFLLAATLAFAAVPGCSTRMQASKALPDDPVRAVQLYRQALAEEPDSARIRIELARALIHSGQYAEANTLLLEAERTLPDDPKAGLYLALAEIGKSGPGGALARLMNYRPFDKDKIGEEVRMEALRASVRDLDAAEVIRRMEAAYERGRVKQLRDDSLLLEADKP